MSKKKSNIIDFKKAAAKKFNDENEIVFTVEGEDYQLGEMVHQASNDNGMEFIFKLEEFDDDEPDGTVH
jgi:mRNA-degrading endonuclease HigB of HigAB toxin-antitoxin module|tara:strand:+ start:503 stop:709 length:207 start_codon:yes stop_codon:yes gene_type:complete